MAIIVEDGSGSNPLANSYASIDTLRAYAKARGETVPSNAAECEALLHKAMDYMRGLRYKGERATKAQPLDWPRYGVYIDNFPYSSTELPRQLEQAQCALAIAAQTIDLLPATPANTSGPVIEEQIGPIKTVYANTGRLRSVPAIASADVLLRSLLKYSGLVAIRA